MGDNASSQEIKGLTLLKHVMPWANDDSTESSSLFARKASVCTLSVHVRAWEHSVVRVPDVHPRGKPQ